MNYFTVSLATSVVTISYETPEAADLLSLLFGDLTSRQGENDRAHLSLQSDEDNHEYQLQDDDTLIHRGPLDVKFSTYLYDSVIFHLLNHSDAGIALHAGGLICNEKTQTNPESRIGEGDSEKIHAYPLLRRCRYFSRAAP